MQNGNFILPLQSLKKKAFFEIADMAQLVEQRIRNAWVAGSSPAIGSFEAIGFSNPPDSFFFAVVAQLVEHWLPKPRVAGSSPVYRSSCEKEDETKKVTEKFAGVK